jgi:hypothetical protein
MIVNTKNLTKSGWTLACILLTLILIIGISVHDDYGISFDEKVEIEMVFWQLQSIGSGIDFREIPFDLEFYGIFFNGLSILFFMGVDALRTVLSPFVPWLDRDLRSEAIYLDKHLFTFLFSSLSYIGISLFIKDLLSWKFAPIGILFLALIPRFWGHSFFNPKDIPFAALFIVVSYFGAQWTTRLVQDFYSDNLKIDQNKQLLLGALSFGVLAGLLSCIRIGGLVVLGFALISFLTVCAVNHFRPNDPSLMIDQPSLGDRFDRKVLKRLILFGGLVSTLCILVVIALTPVAWGNPLGWLIAAVEYMSNHSWPGRTLTLGMALPAQPSWFYLPVWFGVTIPLATLLFAAIGLWQAWIQFPLRTIKHQNLIVWLTLQCFALPVIAIIKQATIYDGERQFLFVIPALIVFAVMGFSTLLGCFKNRPWYIACVALTVAFYSMVMAEMKSLHPYEHIYFNSLARNVGISQNFETDYWVTSGREAMHWIDQQNEASASVYAMFPHILEPSTQPEIRLQAVPPTILDFPETDYPRPFYFLAYPRQILYSESGEPATPHPQDLLPQCETVFQVKRTIGSEVIPLTQVKQCK